MILPGKTIGVMGGGQLGRMFVVAARTMGYKVAVLDPDPGSPAGAMADVHVQTAYDDEAGLGRDPEQLPCSPWFVRRQQTCGPIGRHPLHR